MNEQAYRENIEGIWGNGEKLAGFYSFLINNPHLTIWQCAQIYSVNPNVTICKSYDDWHEQDDRRIKRGEHGIAFYDENQPNRKQFVFDISQTYGGERYDGVKHVLTEKQLCEFVNKQNILWARFDSNNNVESAVYEYCQEHFGNDLDTEYDEEYLACLCEGVTQCLYAFTGNKREPKVGSLPFDFETNFKLCIEVTNITSGLTEAIVEEEVRKNELKKERERRRVIKQREKEDEKRSEVYQPTFWDIAEGISFDGVPRTVLHFAGDGQTVETSDSHSERSGTIKGETDQRTVGQIGFGVYGETEEHSVDGTTDTGDRSDRSSVPPARNYRLTEENFRYETGAKTRFHNNVAAIKLMKELREAGRKATDEEKAVLAKYVGWGGLPYAFDFDKKEWLQEAEELSRLLDTHEYVAARNSVLTAHYTPKEIIDAVFAGLKRLGMKKGKLLEPALGIGNFIGLLPDTFDAKETYGVELDEISGSIATLLYPQTHVSIKGFEQTNFANGSFDGVVSNVPFGSHSVFDDDYKRNWYIHNYFIGKSIDKVRAGGLVAVITTKGTLDKADPTDRQYFANRAKLIGAIRLPNNAFKTSAGTEVTTDILFFQKREHIIDKAKESWLNVGIDKNGVPVNQYFIDHPEMLLGTMAQHKSMYGRDDETELIPDDRTLKDALEEAIFNLPTNVYDETKAVRSGKDIAQATISVSPDYENVKNYCYIMVGGTLYQRNGDQLIAQEIARSNVGRMSALIDLRVQIRHILDIQLDNCSDEVLRAEQLKLNRQYDIFVRNYGLINSRHNRGLFRDDADFALLISVEEVDESKGTATKTDIFSKRTIKPYQPVTRCDNATEALQVSMSEKGCVDLRFIERLTGKTLDEIKEELAGKIYKNPVSALLDEGDPYQGWETASEYLSGNVRTKLIEARKAAERNDDYSLNVEALRAAQPAPLTAAEISVRLGANWIPARYYQQFICHTLDVEGYDKYKVEVHFNALTGEWQVGRETYLRYQLNANSVYGTKRMDAYGILERCLNLQTPTITDEVEDVDGKKKRVVNKQETIAVREKQRKLQEAFKSWIFDEPRRREELVNKYNELFNTTVVPTFDGSYLTFPGMNPEIKLKDYQKDAVARILQGENVLLHHVVGAGKTYEMAAACMKMRQIGIAKKPIIIVPNHLVVQWANEFRTLYPTANILMASKKDFEKTSRKRFVAKVATGDWDCVIMAMSSFEKIPVSAQRQEEKLTQQINSIETAIRAAKEEEGKRVRVKDLQRALANKRAQLQKLQNAKKKDDLLKFEDLGVDYMCVDEAHKYKNKFLFTKQNNVAGISKAMSQRAEDMDLKCEYLGELRRGDKGVTFATGTPISNSLVEMYTMQTFLQRGTLNQLGMQYFDAWAANFTETVTALEIAPSGQGYRTRTRVAKFTNLPELLKLYRSVADVKTAEMLDLPTPEAIKTVVTAQPSDEILELNEEIVERAKRINDGLDPRIDNMLCVTHDGKSIALDPRCFDKTLPDNPNNKINLCVEKVYGIWRDTTENRSTQILFCDMSTPKCAFTEYDPEQQFDVYNDIKTKLVAMGIPQEEIAYIHDAKTDLQKQEIFDKVRRGEIRILLGSTEKCGAGTNIQNKLIALHHLDTPYRPSDLEQREGRIIRQGNENEQVQIFTYVTEKTFDAYSYQLLETKQRFISQINNGSVTIREADDIDETTMSYAEIKAITSANPKIKRKFEIEQELGRLSALEFEYRQNRYRMQDSISNTPQDIAREVKRISDYQSDIERRDTHKNDRPIIGKTAYEKRSDFGAAIVSVVKSQKYIGQKIGTFCGFDIIPEANDAYGMNLSLVGAHKHNVMISDSDVGTVSRMENVLNSLEEDLKRSEMRKTGYESDLQTAKNEVDKPFEYASQVDVLKTELAEIDLELDLDRKEEPIVLENETGDEQQPPIILDEREDEPEIA